MKKLETRHWYAVRTFTHRERVAAGAMSEAGFGVYIPERKVETRHRRTKAWQTNVELIMPGYVLVEFPAIVLVEYPAIRLSWRSLLACKGVIEMLGTVDDMGEPVPLAIPSRHVERVMADQLNMVFDDTREAQRRRGETAQALLDGKRHELEGEDVRITDGPFAGHIGNVETVDSLQRLHLLISIFGRPTPVDLELGQVERLAA